MILCLNTSYSNFTEEMYDNLNWDKSYKANFLSLAWFVMILIWQILILSKVGEITKGDWQPAIFTFFIDERVIIF